MSRYRSRSCRSGSRSKSRGRQSYVRRGRDANSLHHDYIEHPGYNVGLPEKQFWQSYYKCVVPVPTVSPEHYQCGCKIGCSSTQLALSEQGKNAANYNNSLASGDTTVSTVTDNTGDRYTTNPADTTHFRSTPLRVGTDTVAGDILCATCNRRFHGELEYGQHLSQHEPFMKMSHTKDVSLKRNVCIPCKSFFNTAADMLQHLIGFHRGEKDSSVKYKRSLSVVSEYTPFRNTGMTENSALGVEVKEDSADGQNESEGTQVTGCVTPAAARKEQLGIFVPNNSEDNYDSKSRSVPIERTKKSFKDSLAEAPNTVTPKSGTLDDEVNKKRFYHENSVKLNAKSSQQSAKLSYSGGEKRGDGIQSIKHLKAPRKKKSMTLLGVFKCSICNLTCTGQVAYKNHCQTHEKVESETGLHKPYSCEKCQTYYSTVKCLYQHNYFHHPKGRPRTCDTGKTGANSAAQEFDCHICCLTFTAETALTRHSTIHNPTDSTSGAQKPFTCQPCLAYFNKSSQLYIHNVQRHKDPKEAPGMYKS